MPGRSVQGRSPPFALLTKLVPGLAALARSVLITLGLRLDASLASSTSAASEGLTSILRVCGSVAVEQVAAIQ